MKSLATRLGLGIVTIWIVSILIFAGTEVLPGDVAAAILGENATPESLRAIRESLHLDRPAPLRYGDWLVHSLRGDLGKSLASGAPIAPIVARRLESTLFLAGVAAAIAVPLGIFLGVVAATFYGRWIDRLLSNATLVFVALPEFFLGYLLIIVFARLLGIFPSMTQITPGAGLLARLYEIALPVMTLSFFATSYIFRLTRAAVLSVMSNPYIEMARLKGTPEWLVIFRHALPNAVGPIANIVTFNLAHLVTGVIIVEAVFVYPGLGQLLTDAVTTRDVPLVQACGLVFGVLYVALNLAADLIGVAANPRLRSIQ